MESRLSSSYTQPIEKMDHRHYVRSSRSRKRTLVLYGLSIALVLVTLALIMVSIYSTLQISKLQGFNQQLTARLTQVSEEMGKLQPAYDQKVDELQTLLDRRFPNLNPLVANEMLGVGKPYVKNILFTAIRQDNKRYYKYLAVVENNSADRIKPSFRVLLFDEYGVHVASSFHNDGVLLQAGESRDYTAEIEFLFDAEPKHFYIEDLTVAAADYER